MKEFKFKVDINTIYFRLLSGIGYIIIGLSIGWTSFELKYNMEIDWFNSGMLIFWGIYFSVLLPKIFKKTSVIIDESGIRSHGTSARYDEITEIEWNSIRSLKIVKGGLFTATRIEMQNHVGSSERIRLPLHTRSQLNRLNDFLEQISADKKVEFKTS